MIYVFGPALLQVWAQWWNSSDGYALFEWALAGGLAPGILG